MQLKLKFLEKYTKKLPAWLIPTLVLFGVAIYLFSHITHEIIGEQEVDTDNQIFNFFSAHIINAGMTSFMNGVTYFASAPFLQTCYGILIVSYVIAKNYKRSIEIFVVGASGLLVNLAMKYSFHRLRPLHPLVEPLQSFSFPSGHATSGFIFYGLLAYLIWKTKWPKTYRVAAGSLLIAFSLLIGLSRVYLRLHYPSDVAAGVCIGFAWLLLLITLMERIKKKAKQEAINETVIKGQPKTGEIAVPLHEVREL